jgi:hypothetical protein
MHGRDAQVLMVSPAYRTDAAMSCGIVPTDYDSRGDIRMSRELITTAPARLNDETTVPIEVSLTATIEALRQLATEMDAGHGGAWAPDALDRRPLYVVSIVDHNAIQTWVMEPTDPTRPQPDLGGVLHARIGHGVNREYPYAAAVTDTKAHVDVAQAIGWLYYEQHATFPQPQSEAVDTKA